MEDLLSFSLQTWSENLGFRGRCCQTFLLKQVFSTNKINQNEKGCHASFHLLQELVFFFVS